MGLKKNPCLQGIVYLELLILLLLLPFNAWAQDRVKIALWGDSRENKDNACENIADILLNQITDWDFQVHTGDFTSTGSEEDWQRSLGYKGIDSLFVPEKFFMCTSNHDDNRSTYDKYTAGVLPVNSANSTTHFYSYQKENVHIVACDAYFTDAATMQNWLDQELANVPADNWLIGFWHNPCYEDLTYKSSYLDKCAPWLEKFHTRGGDFILHGHAHVYLRTFPVSPGGTVDHENGMVHIINGCGGASWEDPQSYTNKTAFTPATTSFAAVTFITINGDTALVQTVDVRPDRNLAVIDEWQWLKGTAGIREGSVYPETYRLYQNYPNPFNLVTTFRYDLPKGSDVSLVVYDILGLEVARLVDGYMEPGYHHIQWAGKNQSGRSVPSGIYIGRLVTPEYTKSIKMVLLK